MTRKVILILCVCLFSIYGTAAKKVHQKNEAKKVAILETVDKTGKVDYVHKLMLRTNLTKAITEAEGYEGFDRTDLEALLGEQDFQRTGMVSADQIKRLGKMTGAQYILVAEAAMADEANIFATAKIIDVETGRTIKTETQLMRATAQDIQNGCSIMAGNLLGVKLNAGITSTATTPPSSTQAPTPTPATQHASKPKPKTTYKWGWTVDCTLHVKSCYTQNGKLFIVLALANNTSSVFNCFVGSTYVSVFDDLGGEYIYSNTKKILIQSAGKEGSTRFETEIPGEITKQFTIIVPDFNEEAKSIKLCKFMLQSGPWGGMRSYPVEIRNISIIHK